MEPFIATLSTSAKAGPGPGRSNRIKIASVWLPGNNRGPSLGPGPDWHRARVPDQAGSRVGLCSSALVGVAARSDLQGSGCLYAALCCGTSRPGLQEAAVLGCVTH